MLKVAQHRLGMYMEQEMAIERAGFRNCRGTRDNHEFKMDNGKVARIPATHLYVLYILQ